MQHDSCAGNFKIIMLSFNSVKFEIDHGKCLQVRNKNIDGCTHNQMEGCAHDQTDTDIENNLALAVSYNPGIKLISGSIFKLQFGKQNIN